MSTTATNASVYASGNAWQRERYAHMSAVNENAGITRFGRSKGGSTYKHLLQPDDAMHNFLGYERILHAVRHRFAGHKAGDLQRALTNTVASQPCCFNLFVPLQQDVTLASRLFSQLLAEQVTVRHIEIEFTPNTWEGPPGFGLTGDESIGDQSPLGGTDADVALFYSTAAGRHGVVLIEFKYIEAEFSICGSYHGKKGPRIRPGCDAPDWHDQRIARKLTEAEKHPDCGYLKYRNWRLLETSTVLDGSAVREEKGCPFKGSLNQLWRNLLLAERVADARKLDQFHFWVMSPVQNEFLWQEREGDVEHRFRSLLTTKGDKAFRRLELDADVVQLLESIATSPDQVDWLGRFRVRYLPTGIAAQS